MAFITYPLNNIDYTAEDAELFHCTRTSGIWAEDSFPISVTGADNNVTIGTGIAWINNEEFSGKVAALKSAEVLDLGIADSTYPRIDVIAIQFNANNNATDVIIKKGTPATTPVRPAIVRTGAVYELYLASVYRPTGATAITASNVTDLRMDETVCGLMADSVTKIDMDAIRAQLIGLVEELEEAIQNIEVGEIVPIEKGGTNAQTSAEARQNINFIGTNSIASVAEDTTANWAALGTGVAYISGNDKVSNQPYTYGFIENHVYGSVVRQIWYSQSIQGNMYMRAGIASGWYTPWIKVLNENNGIQFEKAWENASPTSDFEEQVITLDNASDYDLLVVVFRQTTTSNYKHYEFAKKGDSTAAQMLMNTGATTANIQFIGRTVLFNNNSVSISDCTVKLFISSTSSTNNNYLLPYEIYGIKGVQ